MKNGRTATAIAWVQALPLAAVFLLFFVIPLGLILMVSFWQATEYELIPAYALQAYRDGKRAGTGTTDLMAAQAKGLTDQQVADLAAFFGSQKGELRDLHGAY